jgi:hypothetical protein
VSGLVGEQPEEVAVPGPDGCAEVRDRPVERSAQRAHLAVLEEVRLGRPRPVPRVAPDERQPVAGPVPREVHRQEVGVGVPLEPGAVRTYRVDVHCAGVVGYLRPVREEGDAFGPPRRVHAGHELQCAAAVRVVEPAGLPGRDVHDEQVRRDVVEPPLAVALVLEPFGDDGTVLLPARAEVLALLVGGVPRGHDEPVATRTPVESAHSLGERLVGRHLPGVPAEFEVEQPDVRAGALADGARLPALVRTGLAAGRPFLVVQFLGAALDGQFGVLVPRGDEPEPVPVGAPGRRAGVGRAGEPVGLSRPVGRGDEQRTPVALLLGLGVGRQERHPVAVRGDGHLRDPRHVVVGVRRYRSGGHATSPARPAHERGGSHPTPGRS